MIAPARLAAFEVLRAVASRRFDLGSALARARQHLKDERDRALAGEIAIGTLRWQGAFDHVISSFAGRSLDRLDLDIVDILRMAIFQLLYLDRVPAAAAVKDAVDLAGKAGKGSAGGLVNAVLRRVSRERRQLPLPLRPGDPADRDAVLAYLVTTLSHPQWLVERWLDRVGFEAAERWARFNNSHAAPTLRVNTIRATGEQLQQELIGRGIDVEPARFAPDALMVRAGNPLATDLDARGMFVVQDEASQLVALYAGARPGERILDACASPGGKTIAMAGSMSRTGLIVASDIRGRRVALLDRTVRRSGATNVRVVRADVRASPPFRTVFDRVLLDAPCSGLGTLRRDPDIKWRRSAGELVELAQAQLMMLERLATVVVPGGTLVYATCSSEPEENDEVVERFLVRRSDFRLVSPANPHPSLARFLEADGRFRTLPHRDGLEAFFAVMLERVKGLR